MQPMAGTAQPTTNTLAVVLKELDWSQMQLVAALRREAARQRVTLPRTQSLVTLISRWVNNHQQPNEFYRGLLSGATARPRAELFGDETSLILPANLSPSAATVIQVASAIPDSFGSERSN